MQTSFLDLHLDLDVSLSSLEVSWPCNFACRQHCIVISFLKHVLETQCWQYMYTCMFTMVRVPWWCCLSPACLIQSSSKAIPSLDPNVLRDLEKQAREVASNLEYIMDNLHNSLHAVRESVCIYTWKIMTVCVYSRVGLQEINGIPHMEELAKWGLIHTRSRLSYRTVCFC